MRAQAGGGPTVRPWLAIIGSLRMLVITGFVRAGECALSRGFR